MLATLILFALLRLSQAVSVTNISASDPAIVFTPGWQNISESDANFLATTEFLCHLTVTLPPSTSSVSYFGYSRTGSSRYGYTLDCLDDCLVQTINGTNPADASTLSTLFTLDVDPSTNHTLRVYNLGTADSSQITFDHLSLVVQDNASAPSSDLNPTTSLSSEASSTTEPRTTALKQSSSLAESTASVILLSATSEATSSNDISATNTGPDGSATSASSDASDSTGGVSKQLVIGLTVFAVVVTTGTVALLIICLRRRRREQQGRVSPTPPSPTSSIIPIMEPPPASMNPFAEPVVSFPDPYSVPQFPLDPPANSAMMQRRQRPDSRIASPGLAPTIPLPDLPAGARLNRMESRSNSPMSSNRSGSRSDMWISRTPARNEFYAV
ncbi:hypothetical protein MIND_00460500 [Mycena indigotica]|uniref:Uncharacterized protein n=1 Tax=Mycena indigotica TaxID=2126181 RepID=A0A8H6SVI9_9AGAR|nr:uncharacterized protein MIND_00460500 [Mycena indigotica]KAF7306688.1 hypothetical protein MIND_00460500 [Mycena indigotica]